MQKLIKANMQMLVSSFLILVLTSFICENAISTCSHHLDHNTLLSFYHHISTSSSSPPLNWSQSTDCCKWEGIGCTTHDGIARVARLWLPERHLSGTITPNIIAHLPFLAHLNLSHNQFSGPLPLLPLSHLLQTLDFSFNNLSGPLQLQLPHSIQTLDLSSNFFSASFHPRFLHQAFNLISFNISNNTLTGPIPSSICKASKLAKILDFSMNQFTGPIPISPGLSQCPNLQVFRAGDNSLSGSLPYDLYKATKLKEISLHDNQLSGPIHNTIVNLPNLTILELHFNQLSGEIPQNIGLLSNLETLDLHNNTLNGTLPPSLMNCSKLATLVLRDNLFGGEVSPLNFSKLQLLRTADLGSNNFTGKIPHSLCSCTSLIALRFSHNNLVGEIPPCMASLKSLQHLALANNYLSNVVGAFKILRHCDNLAVLIMYASFRDEMMPDDEDVGPIVGFRNLKVMTIGECTLKGQIPSWIARVRSLKLLDLSRNRISGEIPNWLGTMPNLCILNLTHNTLSGNIPPQLCQMPALIADNTTSDMIYLALPMLIEGRRYNRFLNMRRVLAVGGNSLGGGIPREIGRLKLVQVLDLSSNEFTGSIPSELSNLSNLETLNVSGNRLCGKIPESLSELHFLSWFSAADNNLEGEIPRGGQFDTFSADSFEGNPKLCGDIVNKSCTRLVGRRRRKPREGGDEEEEDDWIRWYNLPFGLGFFVGLLAASVIVFVGPACACVSDFPLHV